MLKLFVPKLGPDTVACLRTRIQMAIVLEFSTLPPYLYALMSIKPGTNPPAVDRLRDIVREEMTHMCLACNMLNAIGGEPVLAANKVASAYPRPLPGDIGSDSVQDPWEAQLLGFSAAAMAQGTHIEEPEDGPIVVAKSPAGARPTEPEFQTIGEFYHWLDHHLANLPANAWQTHRNQIVDNQFFAGELFAVHAYADAQRAIARIVSQGEGSAQSPVDFEGDLAHYYRFLEIEKNRVLVLADVDHGYQWGDPLGVDWEAAYPAIPNPSAHDFSQESQAARKAQADCDATFTAMMDALQSAVSGTKGQLGVAVRHMHALRTAAQTAFETPLKDGGCAGPTFVYRPQGTRS